MKIDYSGILAGSFCAIHCIIVLLFPGFLATLGLSFLTTGIAEWFSVIVALVIAGTSFLLGFQKHRSRKLVLYFIFGCVALLASRLIEESGGHHIHKSATANTIHETHSGEHGFGIDEIASIIGITGGILIAWGHVHSILLIKKLKKTAT